MDQLMKAITADQIQEQICRIKIGDTLKVYLKIKEGEKERVQMFDGTVIAKKHGGINETFTIRRISYGVGVESYSRKFSQHRQNRSCKSW